MCVSTFAQQSFTTKWLLSGAEEQTHFSTWDGRVRLCDYPIISTPMSHPQCVREPR